MSYCCPLCASMEEYYLTRILYNYDEEMENCEVLEDDND